MRVFVEQGRRTTLSRLIVLLRYYLTIQGVSMLVTKREQEIINEIVKKGKVSITELLDVVGVSRRTLYRDLQNLQQFLPRYQVNLIKADNFYQLVGDLSHLINRQVVEAFSQTERHFMELILLIFEQGKLTTFMDKFAISQPTATNDIRVIEDNLAFTGAGLVREGGLAVIASEYSKRTLLVSSLVSNISTSDIFKFNTRIYDNNKIAQLFDQANFERITQAFQRSKLIQISDRTQGVLRLFFIVTLERISQGRLIENHYHFHPSKDALDLVTRIVQNLDEARINLPEIIYLANMADVLHFDKGGNFLFNEKYDTSFSYKVRQLIADVGSKSGLNFSLDDKIFAILNTHLRSSFTVPQLFSDDKNELVSRIQDEQSSLFQIVGETLVTVFEKRFANQEIALVTLHFVATLESSNRVFPMNALLVTSRGRVSMAFLARKLQTQFPFIRSIKIVQVSQLETDMFAYFDIVFTTEELDDSYQVGGKLIKIAANLALSNLSEMTHDIRLIRNQSKPRDFSEVPAENTLDFQDFFVKSQVILQNFNLSKLDNTSDFDATLYELMQEDNLIDWELLERFKRTSFGIPETNLALIHGVSARVKRPEFKIFDLTHEIEVMGMDKQVMSANRVLFLTAPQTVDDVYTYILGKISSSIIENTLYTVIYSSGNFDIIYELLSKIINDSFAKYDK